MAGSFLSHLDLALLLASLPAWDAVVFYPCWSIRQLADGLHGYLALSWILRNCISHLFTCVCVAVEQGWAMHKHVKASLPFLLNIPSDWDYTTTSFLPSPPLVSKASDPGPHCTLSSHSTDDSALYLSHLPLPFMPLPWHFSYSPTDTQQDFVSWRSYHQSTDYLLIYSLAAAGCVKALILQLNFFTEGGTAEHELLYRGNYTSYRVTALT